MLTLSDEVNFVLLQEKDVFVFNGRTFILLKNKNNMLCDLEQRYKQQNKLTLILT